MKIDNVIAELIDYALRTGLITEADRAYSTGIIMEMLGVSDFAPDGVCGEARELHEILDDICSYAYEKGIIESDGVVYRDLFDIKKQKHTNVSGILKQKQQIYGRSILMLIYIQVIEEQI